MNYGEADELTLSAMTLRHVHLADRIQAAANAGFQGYSWRLEDFDAPDDHKQGESELLQVALLSGLKATEVEYFRDWVSLDNEPEYKIRENHLFSLAKQLGSHRLNVYVLESHPRGAVVESVAALCSRAAPYDLTVQLEFIPYEPAVPTLAVAWEIVREAHHPNLGLILDAWHWSRSLSPEKVLEDIPAHYITSIQLSDGLAKPMHDLADESRHYRLIPGTGGINLPGFLYTLSTHGVKAPLTVEVMSNQLDSIAPIQAAAEVARGTRSMLWRTQQLFQHSHEHNNY